jgi:hypothetical protein
VNKIVALIHKDAGGRLARATGTNIGGFRRVRTLKRNAKAKQRQQVGSVWVGGNAIRSHWLKGKAVNTSGGARVGKHFFADAFVATMGNGYTGVFKRSQERTRTGKARLIEQDVPVDGMELLDAITAKAGKQIEPVLRIEIKKILGKI